MHPLLFVPILCLAPQGQPLPPQSIQALRDALDDERKAEALYMAILKRHGEVRPFSNIVRAEGRHQQAIICLFEAYGIQIPPNSLAMKPPVAPATLAEAVEVSIRAEEDNIALYDRWLTVVKEADIRSTFERLRWASQERHLPALKRHAGS